ncbi:MAG: GNAT family protein [Candidatus Nanopelagicaceae bacterium]|nr:GNAT family protein [Candidatus Nanopelagicaceae bacterium]
MNTLVGHVVRLEPLAIHHTPDLFTALGNDEEAWRWMLAKTPTNVTEMGSFVENLLLSYTNGSREPYAVIHLQSEKAIGVTCYMDIARADRTVEIGSTIYSREYWRTAVNTETKLLLLAEAFEVQDYLRVALKTDGENKRSQAAILRLGAKYEGTLRAHKIRTDGTSRDTVYFSIVKNEWPEVKARLVEALG